ncbi:MAG: hypothetical protein EAZ59_11280 [Oscillatoriales cyanobacterium]|nr:MAG: hypothetical protein EAZ59_11280 [Oscillatoriales cyanobacterium]
MFEGKKGREGEGERGRGGEGEKGRFDVELILKETSCTHSETILKYICVTSSVASASNLGFT